MEILDILASSDMRIEDFFIEYSNRKKGENFIQRMILFHKI